MTSASRSKGEDVTPDFGRVPLAPGSQASPSAATASSPVGADPSRAGMALLGCVAVAVGMFAALWVAGLWVTPQRAAWARSLPLGIGAPVFVMTGVVASLAAFGIPVIAWLWMAGRDSDGSGEAGKTGTGLTEGDSAAPEGTALAMPHLTDQEGQNR